MGTNIFIKVKKVSWFEIQLIWMMSRQSETRYSVNLMPIRGCFLTINDNQMQKIGLMLEIV